MSLQQATRAHRSATGAHRRPQEANRAYTTSKTSRGDQSQDHRGTRPVSPHPLIRSPGATRMLIASDAMYTHAISSCNALRTQTPSLGRMRVKNRHWVVCLQLRASAGSHRAMLRQPASQPACQPTSQHRCHASCNAHARRNRCAHGALHTP